jgi:tetratricopeptide (TPR) repeat protein
MQVRVTSTMPYVGSHIVTVQELRHVVPKKAQREMEKAEKAHLQERKDEAREHLNRAISIDPEFVAARNNLAAIYLTEGNGEAAVAQLEEAVKIDPRNPAIFTNLTLGYTMTHKLDAAERAARERLTLDGTSVRAHLFLGLVLVEKQRFTDEALQCLERAREEFPLAHLLAGRVFIGRGNSEKARAEIQTYLSMERDEGNRALAIGWLDRIENERKRAAALP